MMRFADGQMIGAVGPLSYAPARGVVASSASISAKTTRSWNRLLGKSFSKSSMTISWLFCIRTRLAAVRRAGSSSSCLATLAPPEKQLPGEKSPGERAPPLTPRRIAGRQPADRNRPRRTGARQRPKAPRKPTLDVERLQHRSRVPRERAPPAALHRRHARSRRKAQGHARARRRGAGHRTEHVWQGGRDTRLPMRRRKAASPRAP
jgi:hypothetical protein